MTSRRDFLSISATAAAAAALTSDTQGVSAETFTRVIPGSSEAQEFELLEATLATLQAGLRSGKWTSQQLVRMYSARIAAMDHTGPSLHAMIEMNPEAESIAETCDRERAASERRDLGPLHGYSCGNQGQHRHGGSHAHVCRLARTRHVHCAARLVCSAATARGGRNHSRQNQFE